MVMLLLYRYGQMTRDIVNWYYGHINIRNPNMLFYEYDQLIWLNQMIEIQSLPCDDCIMVKWNQEWSNDNTVIIIGYVYAILDGVIPGSYACISMIMVRLP